MGPRVRVRRELRRDAGRLRRGGFRRALGGESSAPAVDRRERRARLGRRRRRVISLSHRAAPGGRHPCSTVAVRTLCSRASYVVRRGAASKGPSGTLSRSLALCFTRFCGRARRAKYDTAAAKTTVVSPARGGIPQPSRVKDYLRQAAASFRRHSSRSIKPVLINIIKNRSRRARAFCSAAERPLLRYRS